MILEVRASQLELISGPMHYIFYFVGTKKSATIPNWIIIYLQRREGNHYMILEVKSVITGIDQWYIQIFIL